MVVWVYSVYSYSRIGSIERTLRLSLAFSSQFTTLHSLELLPLHPPSPLHQASSHSVCTPKCTRELMKLMCLAQRHNAMRSLVKLGTIDSELIAETISL